MRVLDFKDLVIKYLESLLEVQNQVGICFSFHLSCFFVVFFLFLIDFHLVDKVVSIVLGNTLLYLIY